MPKGRTANVEPLNTISAHILIIPLLSTCPIFHIENYLKITLTDHVSDLNSRMVSVEAVGHRWHSRATDIQNILLQHVAVTEASSHDNDEANHV